MRTLFHVLTFYSQVQPTSPTSAHLPKVTQSLLLTKCKTNDSQVANSTFDSNIMSGHMQKCINMDMDPNIHKEIFPLHPTNGHTHMCTHTQNDRKRGKNADMDFTGTQAKRRMVVEMEENIIRQKI